MSILINGIDMPKYESLTIKIMPSGAVRDQYGRLDERVKAVEIPESNIEVPELSVDPEIAKKWWREVSEKKGESDVV